jgi:hypothetical protein
MTFVTAIHGDEPIPVYALLETKVFQIIGNPKGLALGKRFIERDLNASFGLDENSYEALRAKEILKLIPETETVVDFHTYSALSEPFVVITDLKMLPLALTTGLKHVVFMKHNIKKGHALINHRNGISIEVGRHKLFSTYKKTKEVLKNLKAGKKHDAQIYEVFGRLEEPGSYHNFEKHPNGFYPVLAGEKAYDFFGLKARLINL